MEPEPSCKRRKLKVDVNGDQPPPMKKSKSAHASSEKLMKKMTSRIDGARFRWINEQLYTVTGDQAQNMFTDDPSLFDVYHKGFSTQLSKWPVNPLDRVISYVKSLPNSYVIADFGCGEARLAQSVPNLVHSFDFIAVNDHVTACDMAKVPLPSSSVDLGIFCLSLMGTNIADFIREARRVLKEDGLLKVCEVASRFTSEDDFSHKVENTGFKLINKKLFSKLFLDFEFKAVARRKSGAKLPELQLKPCIYKRR